jgi:glycosyltransferase involved in cell wall biosynthesis
MEIRVMSDLDDIRVSYVLPTKNRARYLERTLANIREFIESNDELIVIDGLSTDDTRQVVQKNMDIVTTFVSELDSGEGHAFNKALFRARGLYIKPIADDDYFYPDAMRHLIAEMDAHPQVDAIQCGGELWDAKIDPPTFAGLNFLPDDVIPSPKAIFEQACHGPGLIVRRSVLEKTGGVSSNCTLVDAEFICRLVECGCALRYLDVNLYRWYFYAHSGSNRRKEWARDDLLFCARLGRLDAVTRLAIGFADDETDESSFFGDKRLLYWIKLADLFSRSPIGGISPALFHGLKAGISFLRSLKRLLSNKNTEGVNKKTSAGAKRQWSGRLV